MLKAIRSSSTPSTLAEITETTKKPPSLQNPTSHNSADSTPTKEDDDIKEMLSGYVLIDRKLWPYLQKGDRIRWLSTITEKLSAAEWYFVKIYKKENIEYLLVESVPFGDSSNKYWHMQKLLLKDISAIYKKMGIDFYIAQAYMDVKLKNK